MKKSILFIVPLPPPIHGASLRNQSLIESKILNSAFSLIIVPIHFVTDNRDIGKFSITKIFKSFILFFNVFDKILKHNPDLVYINLATYGFALYRDSIIVLLVKTLRKPIAIHLRTQKVADQAENSIVKNWMFKLTFRDTSVICLSKNLSKDVRPVYSGKIRIVNNGIELFQTKYISVETNPNGKVRFLFLSNLLKTKGVYDLIEASAQLSKMTKNFEVWIVGKDAELTINDVRENISKYNLESNIKAFEAAYGNEKIKMYLGADVFVLPTHFEAFPGVVLEAMQFGLPVISTNEGAIPEIVDHLETGIIVTKKNIDQLTDAMHYFICNRSEIDIFGKKSKEKYFANYTMEKFEVNMKSTFELILNAS